MDTKTPTDSLQLPATGTLTPDELLSITLPYYNQLSKQGLLRDEETVDDKTLQKIQHAVLADSNAAVSVRLKQEHYRRLWAFKDRYRLDKWKHKDKVKAMKRARMLERKTARADRRQERKNNRAAKWQAFKDNCIAKAAIRKNKRAAKRAAKVK